MNIRTWVRTAVWSMALTAALASGQVPADLLPESQVPADVAKALRDRAMEFFNYHVKTVNRRGMDLVAEENKDYYYNSQKIAFDDYKLEKVAFAKDLQHATVWGRGRRNIVIQGQSIPSDTEVITTWKIEDGKWVWYLDMSTLMVTPMGTPGATAKAATPVPTGELIPSDIASPEKLMAQTQAILKRSDVDKREIVMTYGEKAAGDFTFENNYTGDVMLELSKGNFPVPGLDINLSKTYLKPKENGVVHVEYNPKPGELPENTEMQSFTMHLVLQPFNQIFPLKLTFNTPRPR